MAIAPLEEAQTQATRRLRVIEGGRPPTAGARGRALHARREDDAALVRARAAHPSSRVAPPRHALPTVVRGTARPGTANRPGSALDRRRRAAGLAVVVVSLVLLAMPLRALGAVTVLGQPTPAGVPAGLAPGTSYVVQPGDTLRSIARRVNPAEAGAIAGALARSTGSDRVVPGEHVVIPFP